MNEWKTALTLGSDREITGGSNQSLVSAIRGGADLRIYTEFLHNEHIDVNSSCDERIREVSEFGVTYLVDENWVAGVMSLRQPVEVPTGFGPRPSMSFFLYNQNGDQAIARPYLDGPPATSDPGPSTGTAPEGMAKYRLIDAFDEKTNAPSQNFVYEFETYRFLVNERWQQVLAHDAEGNVSEGNVESLAEAFSAGQPVKVAVNGLCDDLAGSETPVAHEVFVEAGSCYYYEKQSLFVAGTHPVVRIRAQTPMRYSSGAWDFGWLVVRSDGTTILRRCDPYHLAFDDRPMRCSLRWFVSRS